MWELVPVRNDSCSVFIFVSEPGEATGPWPSLNNEAEDRQSPASAIITGLLTLSNLRLSATRAVIIATVSACVRDKLSIQLASLESFGVNLYIIRSLQGS